MTVPIVEPKMISWACERSGYDRELLEHKFKKLTEWERGTRVPTQNQLTQFANTVHVPYGFLFLDQPPDESIQIPDFRTLKGKKITRPSPNLIDIIEAAEVRQDWYREYAISEDFERVSFIGSAGLNSDHQSFASRLQTLLNFKMSDRENFPSDEDVMRYLVNRLEELGVLVLVSGIVGSNTSRKLEVEEFRGFAISDEFAPLIFVNGADIRPAQLFTLAHELGHLVLGKTGLSNFEIPLTDVSNEHEIWCNKFAAELLVPLNELIKRVRKLNSVEDSILRLSKTFKVSRVVILRRLFDAGIIGRPVFKEHWKRLVHQPKKFTVKKASGGNFYLTTIKRLGRKFATALLVDTLNGRTGYRDALEMLGISSMKAFNGLASELGVSN